VDDDPAMRSLTRRALEHVGVRQIFDAKDPVDALPIARAERVHVIISDFAMPRMDGLQFVEVASKDPLLADVGFILLSGVASADVVTRAAELGVSSFIRKPFSIHDLQRGLDAVVSRMTGASIQWM
jgi:two-component system chemotaxis response regulator CheY